jgi:hypothetical protein
LLLFFTHQQAKKTMSSLLVPKKKKEIEEKLDLVVKAKAADIEGTFVDADRD